MSADRVDSDTGIRSRLPTLAALREGFFTLLYLTLLVVGMTVLVTIELVVRL